MLSSFITRQELSDLLGRDVTSDAGALIAVDAACGMCRTVAGQSFNEVKGGTITVDGAGTDAIVLPEFPANKAGTVTVAGGTVTNFVLDTENGLLIRTAGTAVEANESPVSWPLGRQNIKVTYDHGYAETDFPRDVRAVALNVASRLVVQNVASSEEVGDVKVTYGTNATDFTMGERLILSKYRRTR